MRILRAGGHRRMKWKNGGGETTEVVVSPAGAGLDDFDWRVSMARVETDGPFSVFPGIDRTLAVLAGEGIVLDVDGRAPMALTVRYDPVTFPADAPTEGRLVAGPITDLNVMSRRGAVTHSVAPLSIDRPVRLDVGGAATVVVCVEGRVDVRGETFDDRLDPLDALVWEQAPGTLDLSPAGAPARVMVVGIRRPPA